jgi:hypothetical protein
MTEVMAVAKKTMTDFKTQMIADTLWLRAEFFRLVPALSEGELATLIARLGEDSKSAVQQWREAGKIFCVSRIGENFYPAFQFDSEVKPQPLVGEILTILRQVPSRSDWDNALWFIGANGWLDGPSPLEKLLTEPGLVKHAAEQEVAPDIG